MVQSWKHYDGRKLDTSKDRGTFPGGSWSIFRHTIDQKVNRDELKEKILWRAVIFSKGKKTWKAGKDRDTVELWLRDHIKEYTDYSKLK